MLKKGDIICSWEIISDVYKEKDSGGRNRSYVDTKCLLCGTIYPKRRTDNISSKHSQSCRHCQSKGISRVKEEWNLIREERIDESAVRNDIIGKNFGFLNVLNYVKHTKYGEAIYSCQCELCGQIEEIVGHRLTSSNTLDRCSACRESKSIGERFVHDYLTSINISFIEQKTFSDLKGQYSALRFDFAILNNNNEILGLIEVQGRQHYTPIDFFGGEKQFKIQQEYDNKKREYCFKNNIPLLEYPYTYVKDKDAKPIVDFLNKILSTQ